MSEPENFIARWSRRKRAAEEADATPAKAAPAAADQDTEDSKHRASETAKRDEPLPVGGSELPFDLSKLPPLEAIGADTDIRAFLAPGVPPDLARAALRRAWSADPTIRDFVGLSENAWDFNAPDAIPGFGSLEMTDELRRQIAQMVGRGVAADEPDSSDRTATGEANEAPVETTGESAAATLESSTQETRSNRGAPQDEPVNSDNMPYNLSRIDQVYGATQHGAMKPVDDDQLAVKRSHGRALPK